MNRAKFDKVVTILKTMDLDGFVICSLTPTNQVLSYSSYQIDTSADLTYTSSLGYIAQMKGSNHPTPKRLNPN